MAFHHGALLITKGQGKKTVNTIQPAEAKYETLEIKGSMVMFNGMLREAMCHSDPRGSSDYQWTAFVIPMNTFLQDVALPFQNVEFH